MSQRTCDVYRQHLHINQSLVAQTKPAKEGKKESKKGERDKNQLAQRYGSTKCHATI
jgi:hypothetical protein